MQTESYWYLTGGIFPHKKVPPVSYKQTQMYGEVLGGQRKTKRFFSGSSYRMKQVMCNLKTIKKSGQNPKKGKEDEENEEDICSDIITGNGDGDVFDGVGNRTRKSTY